MNVLKKFLKWILYILCIPIIYVLIAVLISSITIPRKNVHSPSTKTIFLNTNGVHLDIIIPKNNIDPFLLRGISEMNSKKYISFGWGEENFYMNTPTWGDLTFKNAFSAIFLKNSTIMHITRYKRRREKWIEIKINEKELYHLNTYIINTFKKDANGNIILIKNKGYSSRDDFFKAKGSYSGFKTCNSWVNIGFKESGLKSCYWTLFDFGLLSKY